jgi:O-antigen/teichoic acid export membrane protein
LKALLRNLLDRYRALRTVVWLAGSAYAVNASRALGAVLARMVLDPVSVGIVNAVTLVTTALAPVSLGTTYGAMRALPTLSADEKESLSRRAFAASAIESCIVAVLIAPWLLPLLAPIGIGSAVFWVGVAATIITRLLSIQESILLSRSEFTMAIRTRLVRSLEPVVGVAVALGWATPLAYLSGSNATGIASLAWRRRSYFPPGLGFAGFWREGFRLLRNVDGYSFKVSLDRMAITIANYIDAAMVITVAGPVSLAGYYLGVNIRGALSQVPTAIFWQRWAGSVTHFESTGNDRFSRAGFLLRLWLVMVGLLALALGLLWLAVATVIPQYQEHYPVAALASLLALPIALSAMLRGRRMLDRRVGILFWFSAIRIGLFLVLIAWLRPETGEMHPTLIAFSAYAAVSLECLGNAADIALHLKRLRLMWLVAALVGLPALAFLPWLI